MGEVLLLRYGAGGGPADSVLLPVLSIPVIEHPLDKNKRVKGDTVNPLLPQFPYIVAGVSGNAARQTLGSAFPGV